MTTVLLNAPPLTRLDKKRALEVAHTRESGGTPWLKSQLPTDQDPKTKSCEDLVPVYEY